MGSDFPLFAFTCVYLRVFVCVSNLKTIWLGRAHLHTVL